ncbi:hypothetical protein M3Y94_01024600 [Aphelenchoides besseyi]|nr:hypothetical protein M3Y94_01024600 [Aphelenchoides besseyi]
MVFFLFVLMFIGVPIVAAYTDAFNVEGQLLCEEKPYENARLVFYEYDYSLPDICYTTTSDRNGTFRAHAYENDGPFKHADQLFLLRFSQLQTRTVRLFENHNQRECVV